MSGEGGIPLVSFKVIPIVGEKSVSRYVAEAVRILREEGLEPFVTPDTTVVAVEDLSIVGGLLAKIHKRLQDMGVERIVTVVMVDDRVDKPLRRPEELVESVRAKLGA